MKLERIYLRGFKSFQEIDIRLNNLNILIGANGAGKSNFLSVFRLFDRILRGELQTFIAEQGGANRLLHFGRKTTEEIFLKFYLDRFSYECTIRSTIDDSLFFGHEEIPEPHNNDSLTFEDETAHYFTKREKGNFGPYYNNFGRTGNKESIVISSTNSPFTNPTLNSLLTWQVYHFNNTSESAALKLTGQMNDNAYLRGDASNLATFLFTLKQTHPNAYRSIRESIQIVAPFFDDFILRPVAVNPDTIRLEWREKGSDFPFLAHHLSDGTLRFICLVTALLQPEPPSVILIDEPELGLHPFALNVLAGLMRKAATKTQLIVSTQSTHLVNQFELDDLLVVNRKDGASTIERLSPKEYEDWLEDYSVGELWEKNVIGGQP